MHFLGVGPRVRANDANELIRKVAELVDGSVKTLSKAGMVRWILCAGNDPFVRLTLAMKAFEIGVIMRKDSAFVGGGIRKNFRIIDTLASPTRFLNCPHVVPQAAQFFDNRQRKILIRIKPGHERLVSLVVADVLINFGGIFVVIVPGRLKVCGSEAHDVLQNLLVRRTQSAGIHQAPNGDPRVANAGSSSAHAGALLNPALLLRYVCCHG
jgi:hypothetical protein